MRYWRTKPSSLRVRLLLAMAGSVVTISSVAMVADYFHEHRRSLDSIATSLTEQASALEASYRLVRDPNAFGQYVNDVCAAMDERIAPGHHILVIGRDNTVLAASRLHSGPEIEQTLLSATTDRSVVSVGGHRLLYVRVVDAAGRVFVLAQYLDHVEAVLRGQLLRRAAWMMVIVMAVTLLTYLAVAHWVVGPLEGLVDAAKSWARRDFSTLAPTSGPADFQAVSKELNSMAQRLDAHEKRRLYELEQARQIQDGLLPRLNPEQGDLRLAAQYQPAAHVAGDLYDVLGLSGRRTAITILDVSGHGLSAAMLTGAVKMSLRNHLAGCADLSEIVRRLNSDIVACTPDTHFVTACVGVWDPGDGCWTYCAAGHPGGILLRAGKSIVLPSTAALLGVLPDGSWECNSAPLCPGDRVVLYTDGVTEAEIDGEQFGLERLRATLERTCSLNLAEQSRAVLRAIRRHDAVDASDDATVLAFEISGRPGPWEGHTSDGG